MNYQETLDYLYTSLPTYHRIGAPALKPSLDNIHALCKALGDPHQRFKSIHIAGTNGKGSTSHMLAAILQESGYKTGLFTSPHLKNFTERIRVNGKEMPAEKVVEFVEKNKMHFDLVKPSFFEMSTAMAFEYFAQEKVEVAVIEAGLGGRLDSTNIIHPLLSVIINISYDHQNILGNTLPEIAREKAGIIKERVPVVVSEYQEEVYKVFQQQANENNSSLSLASEKYCLNNERVAEGRLFADVYSSDKKKFEISTDLPGLYQLKNIPGVLAAVDELKEMGYFISQDQIIKALSKVVTLTGLKGRWQTLRTQPLTICDTAHNEAGIRFVAEQFKSISFNKLHIVFGTVNDKDISRIVSILPKQAYYYFCKPNIPRGLDASLLASQASNYGLKGEVIPEVAKAIAAAQSNAAPEDLIFIGGSNFVVAEIDEL